MRILIDIGHPAHVHIFKHFASQMQEKGHTVLFTVRNKEYEIYLLNTYHFKSISFGKHFKSKIGKVFGLLKFNILLLRVSLKFKPDIFLSHGSIYAAQVSWILRKPHISMEDTFNFEQIKLYKPFTDCILTADYLHPDLGEKCINYSGYHELAYLHPNLFTPDEKVRVLIGVGPEEKYSLIRFIAWNASHDVGHIGLSLENKKLAIIKFLKFGKVFISSEEELPDELKKFKIQIPPEKMHDAIAFSSLFFGESATMSSEAAVMGVPAVFIDNTGRYYTKDQEEKYGLVFNYSENERDQLTAIVKGVELLGTPGIENKWQVKRQRMLSDKINVAEFLIWFVENWPESFKIMKENPQFQERFK
jgi:predicted glycosyltransferase